MTGVQGKCIERAYEYNNYEIVNLENDSDLCYIFFSSHGLYYPDEDEVFCKEILEKNRYEWKWVVNNSKIEKSAARIIFVRDIYKDWYSKGINRDINTVDKTIGLLKDLTRGYRVVTIGSSAGGYMAVLAAVFLEAAWCINISGQYEISSGKYANLVELLNSYKGDIFYFVPILCEGDYHQYCLVDSISCIKTYMFGNKKHADTILASNWCYIIGLQQKQLNKLFNRYKGKIINKYEFLMRTVPLIKIPAIMKREWKGFCERKRGKFNNGI